MDMRASEAPSPDREPAILKRASERTAARRREAPGKIVGSQGPKEETAAPDQSHLATERGFLHPGEK
jgi:hypothetical protein